MWMSTRTVSTTPAASPPPARYFTDAPATYHNGAAGFAFADGHSEIHRWIGNTMKGRLSRVTYDTGWNANSYTGDPDIAWYSFHSPRVSTKTVTN